MKMLAMSAEDQRKSGSSTGQNILKCWKSWLSDVSVVELQKRERETEKD